jgi:hypothetical protein
LARFIQNGQSSRAQFNFPRLEFGIYGPLRTMGYLAGDLDDVFAPQAPTGFNQGQARLGRKHDLCQAVAVSQIHEYRSAVVAITVNPTRESYILMNVLDPQFTTRMST